MPWPLSICSTACVVIRNCEVKVRALAFSRLHPQATTIVVDNSPADRQAHPRARFCSLMQAFKHSENALMEGGRNSRSVIGYAKLPLPFQALARDVDPYRSCPVVLESIGKKTIPNAKQVQAAHVNGRQGTDGDERINFLK